MLAMLKGHAKGRLTYVPTLKVINSSEDGISYTYYLILHILSVLILM